MKQIILTKVYKEFIASKPIITNCSLSFSNNIPNIIKGKNGTGKSTLLHLILGTLTIDKGSIYYNVGTKKILHNQAYKHFSYSAPSIDLVEEFTVIEFFNWLCTLRTFYLSPQEIIIHFKLEKIQNVLIQNLSSGMYQRIKLLQAFCCKGDFLLLDEPCMNFDEEGYKLYHQLINKHLYQRLLIVASNDSREYGFEHKSIDIDEYK